MKFADKFTASYVLGEFGYSAYHFLNKNPTIKTIRMINYSANAAIRELEAKKAAAGMLHFFESIGITHEKDFDIDSALDELTASIKTGTKKANALSKTIDKHYKFDDE